MPKLRTAIKLPPNAPTPERQRHGQLRAVPSDMAGMAAHMDEAPDAVGRLLAAGLLTTGEHDIVLNLRGLAETAGLAARLTFGYAPKTSGFSGYVYETEEESPADIAEAQFRRRLRKVKVGADELAALAVYDQPPRSKEALARLKAALARLA